MSNLLSRQWQYDDFNAACTDVRMHVHIYSEKIRTYHTYVYNHIYTHIYIYVHSLCTSLAVKLLITSLIITFHHLEVLYFECPDGPSMAIHGHPPTLRKHISGLVALLTLRTPASTFTASCQFLGRLVTGEWWGYSNSITPGKIWEGLIYNYSCGTGFYCFIFIFLSVAHYISKGK